MSVLAGLATPAAERTLSEAVVEWLPRQRWFAGKARRIDRVAVHDVALLGDGRTEVLLVVASVSYADGGDERYQIPLAIGPPQAERPSIAAHLPEGPLVDALTVPAACVLLARLCLGGDGAETARGAVLTPRPRIAANGQANGQGNGHGNEQASGPRLDDGTPVRAMGAEQSNSSVVLGEAFVLKVFRKLEQGRNPDVELTAALTESGVGTTPVQHGALELDGREPTVLAVLTAMMQGATEGWDLAVREVEAIATDGTRPRPGVLDEAEQLGEAVARTHAALADAFGRQVAAPEQLKSWSDGMRAQCERVLRAARERAPGATSVVEARADDLDAAFASLPALGDAGPLVRVHGDLHLGQVLRAAHGRWLLLDFEGEPARPLAERRLPHSPLKDVAGMLRSFDYAAAQVRASGTVENWRVAARRRFVAGWERVARPATLVPADARQARRLVSLLELDKAVYELGYELANRPDWVEVPVAGIVAALDRLTRPDDTATGLAS